MDSKTGKMVENTTYNATITLLSVLARLNVVELNAFIYFGLAKYYSEKALKKRNNYV